jgi:hypothetical protein
LTAQGHPRLIFATAIERGNICIAEATARELGRISLEEALALTALVAEKEPERRSRVRCSVAAPAARGQAKQRRGRVERPLQVDRLRQEGVDPVEDFGNVDAL